MAKRWRDTEWSTVLFWVFGALVGVGGGLLAIWADSSDGNQDAWREIGGALLAGAVLALSVTAYQELLENRRHENDRKLAKQAAIDSKRRELDFEMITLILLDAAVERDYANRDFLRSMQKQAVQQSGRRQNFGARPVTQPFNREPDKLQDHLRRAATIAELLGEGQIRQASRSYASFTSSIRKIPSPSDPEEAIDLWRDKRMEETDLWVSLWDVADDYHARHYPTLRRQWAEPTGSDLTEQAGPEGT